MCITSQHHSVLPTMFQMMPKYWFIQKNFETLWYSSSYFLRSLMFCLPSECSCKLSKYLSITAMTNGSYLETEVSKYLNIFFMYKLLWTYSESHSPLQFICLVLSNILLNPLVWINSHNFCKLQILQLPCLSPTKCNKHCGI